MMVNDPENYERKWDPAHLWTLPDCTAVPEFGVQHPSSDVRPTS